MNKSKIHEIVKKSYAERVRTSTSCCGTSASCCGSIDLQNHSLSIGYSEDDLNSAPSGSDLGLGCGNPLAFSSLKEGDTVLDLGSGAGLDCFLAANKVGPTGSVIGVDMTPEMIDSAASHAERSGYKNVEFRLGKIEELPIDTDSVDIIISNCVINLSPEKDKVFKEMYRVLKPGGRFSISDIMLLGELPDNIRDSVAAYVGCLSGAILKTDYIMGLEKAGFQSMEILEESAFSSGNLLMDPTAPALMSELNLSPEEAARAASSVVSVKIAGRKAG